MSHLHQEFSLNSNKTQLREDDGAALSGGSCPTSVLLRLSRVSTATTTGLTPSRRPLQTPQTSTMVRLLLMLASVVVQHAYGRPAVPPLRMKGAPLCTGAEQHTRLCGGGSKKVRCFPPDRWLLRDVFGGGAVPGGRRGRDPLLPHVRQGAAGTQNRPLLGELPHLQGQRERVRGRGGQGAGGAERQTAVVPSGEGVRLRGIHLHLQVRPPPPALAKPRRHIRTGFSQRCAS